MRVVITTTAISTMIVELMTSFLVGHATLRSSPLTSPRYSLGPTFSLVRSATAGALRASGRAWACRCPASPSCAWSVGSSPRRRRPQVSSVSGRRSLQGRRDSNPQPPVLETGALPIELLPSGRGRAGAQDSPRPTRVPGAGHTEYRAGNPVVPHCGQLSPLVAPTGSAGVFRWRSSATSVESGALGWRQVLNRDTPTKVQPSA